MLLQSVFLSSAIFVPQPPEGTCFIRLNVVYASPGSLKLGKVSFVTTLGVIKDA